ncbi:MAG: hypothetical protein HOI66_21345, partial [Verrucomicrobia bacterium]|nr:hypothetical protein [Verrucomicrobiota bacterium]
EFDSETKHPVIALMDDQCDVTLKGGTMRLGAQDCKLSSGTKSAELYQTTTISERHRHRFEFNNNYREQFESAGLVIAGTTSDGKLVELIELNDHPFFVSCQFHPEFQSKPSASHPLFRGFITACHQFVQGRL